MTVIQLTRFARAKLWVEGKGPGLSRAMPAGRTLAASPRVNASPASATLEVVIPRGSVTTYALLGASFQPSDSSSVLELTVMEDEGGAEFTGSLATPPERPTEGMPREFARAVLEGAVSAAVEQATLPAGGLTFDRGAFGPIGSNALIFRQLAASLTRMLLGEMSQWEDVLRQELDLRDA